MAKPQGDIVGSDKWLIEMCGLVANTAPPPYNLRAFDESMFKWEPLRKAIQSRRLELVVTIEQLCDYFGMDRVLMYNTLRRAKDRYDNVKICVLDEIDTGEVIYDKHLIIWMFTHRCGLLHCFWLQPRPRRS